MSTVQEILAAMDTLTLEQLRIVKLRVDSRLADDDDDPALLAALQGAVAYADSHPEEAKPLDKVRRSSPMGFRIEITEPAIADLAEIVSCVAQDKPQAATALGNHLLDAVLTLKKMPSKGTAYPHPPLAQGATRPRSRRAEKPAAGTSDSRNPPTTL